MPLDISVSDVIEEKRKMNERIAIATQTAIDRFNLATGIYPRHITVSLIPRHVIGERAELIICSIDSVIEV